MSGHLRVFIGTPRPGARGLLYDCHMNTVDGLTIVTGTIQPLFDTARVLAAKGVKGELQLWDSVRPYCRLRGDIERLAGMTVSEGDRGLCLRPYTERTASGDFADEPSEDGPEEIGRPGRAPRAPVTIREAAA